MNALSSCDASDPWVRDHMSIVWVIADRCGRRVVCGWLSLILFAGMYIATARTVHTIVGGLLKDILVKPC